MTVLAAIGANTQAILAGVASAATQLSKPATSANYLMQVINRDPAVSTFIKFGTSSGVTATAADFPVQPGDTAILDVPLGTTHVAVIGIGGAGGVVATAATVATYFTPCYGQSYL